MYALYDQIVPPSGVEFAVWLRLLHTTHPKQLVIANSNLVRIFKVCPIGNEQAQTPQATPNGTGADSPTEFISSSGPTFKVSILTDRA